MYEVEAKVHLTKAEFNRLKKQLNSDSKKKGLFVNKDVYFAVPEGYFLRIRERNKNASLDFKVKHRKQGMEINWEANLPLHDPAKMKSLLKKLGLSLWVKKEKISLVYQAGTMTIELNRLTGLGYFLEIETLVEQDKEIPKAKKRLHQLFHQFGFSPKDFESKYYMEMLAEKAKHGSN